MPIGPPDWPIRKMESAQAHQMHYKVSEFAVILDVLGASKVTIYEGIDVYCKGSRIMA